MILITTVAGVIGRFAGRVLNSALGWATVLLFGKVAQSRQILLLLVTLGSLAWAAALAGVLVPSVGTFLLAAVPAPDFVEPNWLRLAMLAVPIVLKPGGYDGLIDGLADALESWDLPVTVAAAPRALSVPARILAVVGGPGVRELVPHRLLALRRPDLRVLVYPSDISISGRKTAVLRARAAIAIRLPRAPAYLTVSKESQQLEDRLLAAAAGVDGGAGPVAIRQDLAAVDRRLQELAVPFEEWETLYRQRVQIERDLLARDREPAAERVPASRAGTWPPAGRTAPEAAPAWPDWAAAALGFGLIAVDVGLLLLGRIAPPDRHRDEGRGARLSRWLARRL